MVVAVDMEEVVQAVVGAAMVAPAAVGVVMEVYFTFFNDIYKKFSKIMLIFKIGGGMSGGGGGYGGGGSSGGGGGYGGGSSGGGGGGYGGGIFQRLKRFFFEIF